MDQENITSRSILIKILLLILCIEIPIISFLALQTFTSNVPYNTNSQLTPIPNNDQREPDDDLTKNLINELEKEEATSQVDEIKKEEAASQVNEIEMEEATREYNLYFANSNDLTPVAVKRSTDRKDVATFLVEELIKGPTPSEAKNNLQGKLFRFTSESDCNGRDFQISLNNGDITVRFCRDILTTGDIDPSTYMLHNTLTELPGVNNVYILDKDNKCYLDLYGEGTPKICPK